MENLIENVKELFSSMDISVVISYAITFISIILSLLAYFHSKRTQKPRYLISSASLRNEMFKDSSISLTQPRCYISLNFTYKCGEDRSVFNNRNMSFIMTGSNLLSNCKNP
jgi:hypothetical protein